MTNRPEWIAAVFGVSLAGGVAVLLSTFSAAPELDHLLQVSDVSILLFEPTVLKKDFTALLASLEPQILTAAPGRLASLRYPFLRRLVALGYNTLGQSVEPDGSVASRGAVESWPEFMAHGTAISADLVDSVCAAVLPAHPGVLFFSSGSTSRPKGILGSHRSIVIQCWRWPRMLNLQGEVRTWTANGFFWSGNFTMAMGCTFAVGGTLVLQPTFNAVEALELMQNQRVTLPLAWPHQHAQLVGASNWSQVNLGSLRYVDTNLPLASHPTVASTWNEPRWAYGNTETFTLNCAYPSGTPGSLADGTHGVPLPGNTVKIVDPLTGATVVRSERGEIAVKGPTLMMGYIDVPIDETLDSEGFFHTGDGGYLDETGRLIWEGRLTDIIKTGGANVSPVEIDSALLSLPGLKIGRTVGVPHDTLGEMVVTCVVPHEGVLLQEETIRDYLKERLASYKVPRRVLFFREDELAMTGNAKVKSSALRELAGARLKLAGTEI